jgi:hypothetical protein
MAKTLSIPSTREVEVGAIVDIIDANFEQRLIVTECALGKSVDPYVRQCVALAAASDCDVVMLHNGRRLIAHGTDDPVSLLDSLAALRMR